MNPDSTLAVTKPVQRMGSTSPWSVLPLGTATGRAPVSKILTVANRLMALPEVNAS